MVKKIKKMIRNVFMASPIQDKVEGRKESGFLPPVRRETKGGEMNFLRQVDRQTVD